MQIKWFNRMALLAALVYCLIACVWIFLYERLLTSYTAPSAESIGWEIIKDLGFIIIPAAFTFFLLRKPLQRWEVEMTGRKRVEADSLRLAAIVESSDDAIISKTLDGVITSWNAGAEKIFGYSAEEILGRPGFLLFPADRIKEEEEILAGIIQGKTNHHFESVRIRKDGKRIDVSVTVSIIKDADGRTVGASVIARDITAQKEAERDVAKLSQLVEQSPVAVVITDTTGAIEYVNQAFCRVTGYVAEELIGKNPRILKSGELSPAAYEKLWATITAGQTWRGEFHNRRKNGELFWEKATISPMSYRDGKITHYIGIKEDITAHKLAEESRARLATAVDQAAEAIIITDNKGTIVYANPAFEKSSGYSVTEALGQNPRILKSGKQDAAFYRQMWDGLKRGEVWHGHFSNRRKDGSVYEEEATISPVRHANGEIVNYVAVKRDVTHEVELETQIRQTQKMEAVGQLAAGVAHDFNNILAIIQIQAGLLKAEKNLSARQLDFAGEIERATTRAANLTRQLLLFSRKQALQLRDADLNEIVAGIAKMLQRTLGEDAQMQLKLAAQPLLVHADLSMMDQVLMNLAINARDAMPKGGRIVVETGARLFDAHTVASSLHARFGSFAFVSVSDTGCGIAPEILSKIFEPFFTTKELGKGSGLGLATVAGIVEQHNGWVDVYSEVGLGTTFRVYLPRTAGVADNKSEWNSLTTVVGGKETILLVEDDLALRTSIQTALLHLGYRVLKAATATEAWEVWRLHGAEIQLLLTDMVMPGHVNGKELARRLLQDCPRLKIIYTSGYSVETAGQDLHLQEGVNFLSKPFEAHKLALIVRSSLDKV